MSVIKIPSKNIFSMKHSLVLDNAIDKIEVRAKKATSEISEKSVFSDTIINNSSFVETKSDAVGTGYVSGNDRKTLQYFEVGCVRLQGVYKTYKIEIPRKNQGNYFISKIIDGKDSNGSANIQYSIWGEKKTTNITGNIIFAITKYGYATTGCYLTQVQNISFDGVPDTQPSDMFLVYDKDLLTIETSVPDRNPLGPQGDDIYANASFDYVSNIGDSDIVTLNEKNDCYELEFQILTDLTRIATKGEVQNPTIYTLDNTTVVDNVSAPLTGTQESYVASKVTLTVKGIVVEVNLEDEIVTIGEGDNIISFDGNELMQTTNIPSVEDTYQKVIDQYKDGKETAVIRCSIDDYYDTDGQKVIGANTKPTETTPINVTVSGTTGRIATPTGYYSVSGSYSLSPGKMQNLAISQTVADVDNAVRYSPTTGVLIWTIYSSTPNTEVSANITGILTKSLNLPMSFHLHDEVIPYVYTASGQDVPMSEHKNGTPKVFEVLGSKIYYDGAVWQELTLQEK